MNKRTIGVRDLGPQQTGTCTWCKGPVKKPRRTWCSQACVDEYQIRSSPNAARDAVWKRDQGCCQRCALDVGALKQAIEQSRLRWGGLYLDYQMTQPKPAWLEAKPILAALGYHEADLSRSLWDMDHIVPVVEGGGACGLENLRVLCVPCHREVTAEQARARAAARRAYQQSMAAGERQRSNGK